MGSKITCNPNFHSRGMFEGRIQEGLSSGVQGWLDAHLRGSKSSFSSYINGSTANFQEGFSMQATLTRYEVNINHSQGKVLPSVRVSDPGLLLKPDEPNLIIMAKPACGPSKRDKPVGMDED
ncbi:hypothetical protein L3X38_000418 [Prunus dulcis]|uniref:Uncharacterized protein n=1 Tax=Prunus dulcis TaxID=3755 RepID=A0AAD4WQM7_PRUDU|nr:hypothetical protein L3X38_000418 [Prunus dulcis]